MPGESVVPGGYPPHPDVERKFGKPEKVGLVVDGSSEAWFLTVLQSVNHAVKAPAALDQVLRRKRCDSFMDTPPTISPAFLSFLSPDPQHCFVEQKICVCPHGELRQREELQRRIMALAVDTWQPFFVSVEQRTVEVGTAGLRSQAISYLLWAQGSQRHQEGSLLPHPQHPVRPMILVIPWLGGLVDASPDLCLHHMAVCVCVQIPLFL